MSQDEPDLSKFPQWLQKHVKELERQRDTAVKALKRYDEAQTPTPFFIEEMTCLSKGSPTYRRRYIQEQHSLSVLWEGVRLDIILREKKIDIKWGDEHRACESVLFQPSSFQAADLIALKNVR